MSGRLGSCDRGPHDCDMTTVSATRSDTLLLRVLGTSVFSSGAGC